MKEVIRKDRLYKSVKFRYGLNTGLFAWILHRLTGLALVLYLLLHLTVLSSLAKGPESFNSLMAKMNILLFKVLEVGLFGVFVFHGLNGIRVIMSDFGMESKYHKNLFWVIFSLVIILVLVGGYPIIRHAIH